MFSEIMEWLDLKVSHIERLTEDSVRLDLFPAKYGSVDLGFSAGQYLTFEHEIAGELVRRSYSICSSPSSAELSVGIKEVPEGKFSTFANRELKVGDVLRSLPPDGNFINEDETSEDKNFCFVAAGSGITPILSLLKSALESSSSSQVTLFYGNKDVRSIMFLEELEALKNTYMGRFRLFHILSRQQQDSDLFNGRIDAEKLGMWNKLCLEIDKVDAYFLCGPEKMILSLKEGLSNFGVPSTKVHFELFTTEAGQEARQQRHKIEGSQESTKKLTVILDGKTMEYNFTEKDDNILDKALTSGADLPFACKGGVCCTCKAKLEVGEVKMYVNYGLEKDEMERGFILTCQSYPVTESVTVNFDEV